MSDRVFPQVDVRRSVACQSYRVPFSKIKLLVVHATEGTNLAGIRDLQYLGDYFNQRSTQASSHVATDAEGNSARYVKDSRKAWHVAGFNSVALGIEQIGHTSQGKWPAAQLHETARWLAYWSRNHRVPLHKGAVHQDGSVLVAGVVRHSDLGEAGGNHDDPGSGYDLSRVLKYARAYALKQAVYEKAHGRKVHR